MRANHAWQRLLHPFTLSAVGLVAFNDLILRPLAPASWWSGKLSTFGAAFALPVFLAALLSLLWPRRPRMADGLAFGAVLAGLLLLKASPLSNAWLTSRFPLRAVPDPSDLLAVLPWGLSLIFYFRPNRQVAANQQVAANRQLADSRLPRRAWLLISLSAFFLLADAAAPVSGVDCLVLNPDGSLTANVGYLVYLSADNGRSWVITQLPHPDCQSSQEPFTLSAGARSYRVSPGTLVESSSDGSNWQALYSPLPLSQPEQVYARRSSSANIYYQPGPLDAKVAPNGDLVLAMGLEGVLIIPADGQPVWVAVGEFRHNNLSQSGVGGYFLLLGSEFWLSIALALAWLATTALRRRSSVWQIVLTILGWLAAALAWWMLDPSFNTGYGASMTLLAILANLIWWLVLAVIALLRLRKDPWRSLLFPALWLPLVMALFLLPYILWASEILPAYSYAQFSSAALLILTVLFLPGGLAWHQKTRQHQPESE